MEDPLFGKPARNFAPRTIWTGDNLDPECPVIRPSMPAALAPFYAAAWSSRSRAWWTWWAPWRVHWPPVRVRCPVAFSLSATFAHERPAPRCSMIAASVSCSPSVPFLAVENYPATGVEVCGYRVPPGGRELSGGPGGGCRGSLEGLQKPLPERL